jgi:hypothetical protein
MVLAPPSVKDGVSYRWVNDALVCNAPNGCLPWSRAAQRHHRCIKAPTTPKSFTPHWSKRP